MLRFRFLCRIILSLSGMKIAVADDTIL